MFRTKREYDMSRTNNEIMKYKIEAAFKDIEIIIKEIEDYSYDGWIVNKRTGKRYPLELKQRQNHQIHDHAYGIKKFWDTTRIPASSTKHGAYFYIIYDLDMDCFQIFDGRHFIKDSDFYGFAYTRGDGRTGRCKYVLLETKYSRFYKV